LKVPARNAADRHSQNLAKRQSGAVRSAQALAAMPYTHEQALQVIERAFPMLAEELHDEVIDGLLHLQIGEFSRLAQAAVEDGDKENWAQITSTFMELWLNSDAWVKNALNVSFLEHLIFNDGKVRRSWAFDAMPPPMRKAWREVDDYNRRLHGG
jgi:hypothetical protein